VLGIFWNSVIGLQLSGSRQKREVIHLPSFFGESSIEFERGEQR
jgi:hypothetical protein